MKKTTEQGITALYCRLSRDDGAEQQFDRQSKMYAYKVCKGNPYS